MKPLLRRDPPGSSRDWLAHAESDLNLARIARERQDVLPEQACFHAQQAAEKALKAVLLFERIEFPLVHDLKALIGLLRDEAVSLPPEVREAGSLTPYAVEARYPGHLEAITPSDVDEAIRLAEVILRWAEGILQNR
jgi:HEPN domain-containing protein